VIPWSPLARGFLAGNRQLATERAKTDDLAQRFYIAPSDSTIADRVAELAQRRGVTAAQIALAWILHKPGVTAPIVAASKLVQLDQAIAALEISLDEGEMQFLEEPYEPHRVIGH